MSKEREDILRKEYEKIFTSPKYDNSVNKSMNQQYIFPAMDQYYNQAIDDALKLVKGYWDWKVKDVNALRDKIEALKKKP